VSVEAIRRLLVRADDVLKAAPARPQPETARDQAAALLDEARSNLDAVADHAQRRELAGAIARRVGDLDRAQLEPLLAPSPGVRRAPTEVTDPSRVPPGQRLTAGWPVLHVGSLPRVDRAAWRVVVTGRVRHRLVLRWEELADLPTVTGTSDLHCVTGWSRLDNTWEGVPVAALLDRAGPRPEATHGVVAGHPAYSANLPLEVLRGEDVLLAWRHDGRPLAPEHGGPLRLVVPSRYGWKSVKWVTELRLTDRDVPGYWEERGYHDEGDPWREERYRDR
jgi:DMSO/TMAO reductase YedYZ molybdopterin-dependent catalytic subunit